MRVSEVILDLTKRFPRSPIEAWQDSYYDALRPFEGPSLSAAYREIMSEWTEPGPPKPAHIVATIRLPQAERKQHPWEIRDQQRAKRAQELNTAWRRELAEWFATAKDEGWDGHLALHVRSLSFQAAHVEIDGGKTVTEALAWANSRDRRIGYPLRAPDELVDKHDAAIFRMRAQSQRKYADKGGKRGDAEPKWKLGKNQAAIDRDEFAERLSKMRAKTQEALTARHMEQQKVDA